MTFRWLIAIALVGCGSSTPPAKPPIADPIPMTEPTAAPANTPAAQMLAAYERTRALLADDQMAGLPDAAREIEKTAQAANLAGVATAAAKLATTSEIEAARATFGDVSREVVAVVAADPALAKGQHIFECPMVKGYRKWIQPSQEMANPYMGKKMLACGGETSWK